MPAPPPRGKEPREATWRSRRGRVRGGNHHHPDPLPTHSAAPSACTGFKWGGECWTSNEGRDFVGWLNRHGASAAEFKANHPELASVFKQPWPPPKRLQLWQTCQTGAKCAEAVIGKVFGAGWRYAYAIASCETGGTFYNRATGSAGERGWFQIHPTHFGWLDEEQLWDVRYNTKIAYRMSKGGTSWGPWTCARMI